MMKREMNVLFFVLSLMIFFSFIGSVSAQAVNIPSVITDVISKTTEIAKPIFSVFVGDYSSDSFFFTKVLILILIFVIVKVSLRVIPQFKDLGGVVTLISAIVAILAIRFMKEEGIFAGILLPYGTLGIVLATTAPFIAFLYILHAGKANGAIRRLGWFIYLAVFVALFISRYAEITKIGRTVYYIIFGAILLSLIFDKGIHRYFQLHEMSAFYTQAHSKTVSHLQAEYLNILNLDTPEADKRKKDIESHLKRLGADVP